MRSISPTIFPIYEHPHLQPPLWRTEQKFKHSNSALDSAGLGWAHPGSLQMLKMQWILGNTDFDVSPNNIKTQELKKKEEL